MTKDALRRPRTERVLAPESVAIVGASARNHITQSLLRNLRDFPFPGRIHLVNPNYQEIDGWPCHPTVEAIGEPVDLAVILVPADAATEAVASAVRAGVPAVMIMTAGFGEDQRGAGKYRERALLAAIAGSDVVICGPNAEGFIDVRRGLWLSFSPSVELDFLTTATQWAGRSADLRESVQGSIAVISQSGGLGFSVFGRGAERGIGFSHVISVGNELDLDVLECAEHLIAQSEVRVVAMYVEGFRKPERLRGLAAAARSAGKFLVIGKAGGSKSGGEAAVSHTGHLAGAAAVNEAVFREFGVISVADQDEMLDACAALASCPPMAGNRIAAASLSGGSAVWTADACERHGLELPELDAGLRAQLSERLPAFANIRNPIDLTGASKTTPAAIIETISRAPYLDGFIAIAPFSLQRMAQNLLPAAQITEKTGKPVVAYSYTTPHPEARRLLRSIGVPIYESSTRAARALAVLKSAGEPKAFAEAMPSPPPGAKRRLLSERETTERLRLAGLPTARQALAATADQAVAIAAGLGGPAAMKLQAPSIPHKDQVGGVMLDVRGGEDVRAAYHRLMARAEGHPDVEGVLVQEMVPGGIEMIVGVDNTSGFGPIVLVGFGGRGAEAMNDSTLRCAPLKAADVRTMLAELRHGAILTEPIGGLPRFPVDAFVDLVVRVSEYAVEHAGQLLELDINPVVLTPTGVRIVDSMMVEVQS